MEEIILESMQLKKDVCAILGKLDNEKIYSYELSQIDNIRFNKYNFLGNENVYYFQDIQCFQNLKSIRFNQFDISNEIIEMINNCKTLESLTFNHCDFKAENDIVLNIESIYITHSNINNLINFKKCNNINSIKIIECGEIDIKLAKCLRGLKEIEIYNSKIVNANEFNNFNNLQELKLDGTVVDNFGFVDNLDNKIKYQHNERFYLIP